MINTIKKIMYADDTPLDTRFELNDAIFKYDEERAKSTEEVYRAGNEWIYRLTRLCDYLATNGEGNE